MQKTSLILCIGPIPQYLRETATVSLNNSFLYFYNRYFLSSSFSLPPFPLYLPMSGQPTNSIFFHLFFLLLIMFSEKFQMWFPILSSWTSSILHSTLPLPHHSFFSMVFYPLFLPSTEAPLQFTHQIACQISSFNNCHIPIPSCCFLCITWLQSLLSHNISWLLGPFNQSTPFIQHFPYLIRKR